jgi:hypothetical protein
MPFNLDLALPNVSDSIARIVELWFNFYSTTWQQVRESPGSK